MYQFHYHVFDSLPKLSWLAEIHAETQQIDVFCGNKVERCSGFFVTGVWDGAFLKADFDHCEAFFGTGAKITEAGVRFVTPSHALERLVLYRRDTVVVSNSIPFLLSYCGLQLDNRIDQYERMLCSVLDGPDKMIKRIPLKNHAFFDQYIVSFIHVNTNGEIEIQKRPAVLPFQSFDQYYSRLMNAMSAVRNNSVSPDRRNSSFGIVSTLSSGYDSSTCSAVAKKLGCDTVAALCGGRYDKDDGREIAKQLGYQHIVRRDMDSYREIPGAIDAEFLCSGEMGTMLQFSVFEDVFQDNLVFFGLRGSYWSKKMDMTDDFEMIGYFNCEADISITEYALRKGFIMIPLPTFGASSCSSINRISNSEEMKPWTLGTEYDKPIPRRILETNGVSRASFGQKKYGGGFSLYRDTKKRLSKRMSIAGYQSFEAFLKLNKGIKWGIKRWLHCCLYVIENFPIYLNHLFRVVGISYRIKQKPRRIANPGAVADLFFWGVARTKERYAMNQSSGKE